MRVDVPFLSPALTSRAQPSKWLLVPYSRTIHVRDLPGEAPVAATGVNADPLTCSNLL